MPTHYIDLKLSVDLNKALSPENVEGITYLLNSSSGNIDVDYLKYLSKQIIKAVDNLSLPDVAWMDIAAHVLEQKGNLGVENEGQVVIDESHSQED